MERQAGRGEAACDRCRRSELVTPVVAGVGLGVAGSCSDGCIAVGQGVAALVAIGGGTDGEPAQGSRSSSPGGEVRHGGGGRTRRCAVAIVMVMVIFGSGGARSDTRTGAALGDGGMRLGRGSAFAEGGHSTETIRRWLAGGQPGRRAGAGDHDRRSVPIALIVSRLGFGDAGPCRHCGAEVRRDAQALVAIGDGADAEHAHGTCSSSGRSESRHDVGGRSRRCTIIIFIAAIIVTGTSGSARSPCARRCEASVRRWRAAPSRTRSAE